MKELLHPLVDVLGDTLSGLGPAEGRKRGVAEGTPGERSNRSEGKAVDDLADLVLDVVAGDEEMVLRERTSGKGGVARQDDAVLLQGALQEVVVGEGMVIEDVEAEEAKTSG